MFDNYNDENKYYHLNKTKECYNKNINLLHIFENEWDNEVLRNIWKSVINYKLGIVENRIFARKTVVKEINYNIDEFLINNHLQGKCSSSVKIGLFYNEELVSVMTFGKSRFNKNVEWELLRYCNIINTQIIGGASKLFNYFLKTYNPSSIVSYANRRWSNGNLYEKLNFEFDSITEPNYFYFKENDNVLHSRIKFQKHKLNNILENFDNTLSETINMYNNGYRKIYDCGNLKYIWYR